MRAPSAAPIFALIHLFHHMQPDFNWNLAEIPPHGKAKGMRHTALAMLLATLACKNGVDPDPGSRQLYESCQSGLMPEDELCGEGLVCQGSRDPTASYCAPSCSRASDDIYSQDPECPEIDGFVSYCANLRGGLSCAIVCDNACPDGLGLLCPDHTELCVGDE